MLLPMHETICASINDAVKMRCLVWCGSNHSLRLVGSIRRFEAEETREQGKTNCVCLWRTHLVLNRKRTDTAERVNRKNLLGLRVTLKMCITVVRHDAA